MIDRKALWIALAIGFAMAAALAWRLSLLPDWHRMPLGGSDGKTTDGLKLFLGPGSVILVTLVLYFRKFIVTGSEETLQSWRRWSNRFAIANSVIIGVFFAFLLARSLGQAMPLEPPAMSRALLALMGVFFMVMGNALPKLTGLSQLRLRRLQLDPWQQNRHYRFIGKVIVAMGVLVVGLAVFQPLLATSMMSHIVHGSLVLMVAAILWHYAKVKREPSPH